MTAYNTIADGDIDPESPITTTLMTRLRDNAIAITEGSSGAPEIQTAALEQANGSEAVTQECIRAGAVGQTEMDSSAVGQGQLKTAEGSVSTGLNTLATLPGGAYGFYPRLVMTGGAAGHSAIWATADGPVMDYAARTYHGESVRATFALLDNSSGTSYVYQRYIQASPPYDLGDGEIPLFIFAEVDSDGEVVSAYEAPEAPWHYNGPTNIKADFYKGGKSYQKRKDSEDIDKAMTAAGHPPGLTKASSKALSMLAYQDYHLAFNESPDVLVEVTQDIKQADMGIIPRPMTPADGNTVIMLDPVADLGANLFEMKKHDGFNLNQLLHEGDLIITDEVNRAGPPGVAVHGYKWR